MSESDSKFKRLIIYSRSWLYIHNGSLIGQVEECCFIKVQKGEKVVAKKEQGFGPGSIWPIVQYCNIEYMNIVQVRFGNNRSLSIVRVQR